MHSTNYYNTLIEIAEDCAAQLGEQPPLKEDKVSVANLQFDLISQHPYKYTSDDVLFKVFAIRKDLTDSEMDDARSTFFSKGQPCFRASPLTKRYGWGLHSDESGKIALVALESAEYETFLNDSAVIKTKAMRSKRA